MDFPEVYVMSEDMLTGCFIGIFKQDCLKRDTFQ